MANKDFTTTRVRNVMNQMPKSILEKRESKVRNTVRSTLSSMKSILGQLKHGNMNKLRQEKRRRRIVAIAIIVFTVVAITLLILYCASVMPDASGSRGR